MPRPRKCRTVGFVPVNVYFYPQVDNEAAVVLSIEEVEAMRLADYLEMEQDSAALSMNVSRGTLQRMLNSARKKVTDALIHGKTIRIDGGVYQVLQGQMCCKRHSVYCQDTNCEQCEKRRKNVFINKENSLMKIAIATEGTQVSAHFGKCENFTIVEIENSEVKSRTLLNTAGNQHGQLPIFLLTHGAQTVVSGGMGDGAKQNLRSNGIEIITGVEGSVEETIEAYLKGTLKSSEGGCSSHGHSHDDHHHEHGEGEGGCKCGHN